MSSTKDLAEITDRPVVYGWAVPPGSLILYLQDADLKLCQAAECEGMQRFRMVLFWPDLDHPVYLDQGSERLSESPMVLLHPEEVETFQALWALSEVAPGG